MKIENALLTYKKIARKNWQKGDWICYYKARTGPYQDLVKTTYFVISEDGIEGFSTSIDVYPEELFADDWIVVSDEKEKT